MGHELRGMLEVHACGVKDVHLPLATLVDSEGWRLLAIAWLPIDRTTLIYGSSDAGNTLKYDEVCIF